MKKVSVLVFVMFFICVFCFISANIAIAQSHGTADEAKKLVNDASAFYKANGKTAAFKAFDDPKGKFVKKDLYIFVINWDAVILSHGANAKLIGKPLKDLKDNEGKLFMRELVEVAKTKGSGWVDYKWVNPVSKKIESKSSYVQRIEKEDLLIGCGIYKGN